MKRKVLSFTLCIIMCLSMLPGSVFVSYASATDGSAWLALQQDVQSSGTVTLTEDVICDDQTYGPITIPEGVTVTIDLNGHKIDRNLTEAVAKGVVLDVYGSLTVKDGSSAETGTITGGNNTGAGNITVGGGIQVTGGELVLESGSITDCSTEGYGGGVNVDGGSFNMTGGSINGNYALSHGGGVSLTSATFNMTGGTISGNRANAGGGIRATTSDLFLSGGIITGNEAIRYSGGGLDMSGDANATLTGCQITGNTAVDGGGVNLFITDHRGCSFKVGKNTMITGNTDKDGNDSNLHLSKVGSSSIITIMDGEDAPSGMNIGISSEKTPSVSDPVQVSTASAAIGDLVYFSSDSPAYDLIYTGGIIQLAMKDTCGVSFKCGAHGTDPAPVLIEKGGLLTCPENPSEYGYSFLGWYKDEALQDAWDFESGIVNENMVLYGKWRDSTWLALQQAVKSSGTVTLTEDVICDNQTYGSITIPEGVTVAIDLNGHKIDRNLTDPIAKGNVIEVLGSLTVKDGSSAETGTITGGNNTGAGNVTVGGGIQVTGGEFVLESGSITDCSTEGYGGGVNVEGGSFNMAGGSINGNYALSHGGGVSLTSATFNMTGGTISGNRANAGGGIRATTSDLFLSGGVIKGNEAIKYSGGGLDMSGDANATLTGCQITGNTAADGGGVNLFITDHSGCSFKLGKNTVITGNTDKEGNDSNLHLPKVGSSSIITIMDGEDAPSGMNIGISSGKTLTVSEPVQVSDSTMQKAYNCCFFSDDDNYWTAMIDGILYLTAEQPSYSVTYTGSDKVTFSGEDGELITAAKEGDMVRFTVTHDPEYTLGAISAKTAGGKKVDLSISGGVYSFTMPADYVTVTANIAVDVPEAESGLIYDGTEKTGVAAGTGYVLTGNTAADAGNYTATAKLEDGYQWSDGSPEDKAINWSIAPIDINGAEVGDFGELTYTGTSQTPTAQVKVDDITVTGIWSDVLNVTDNTSFTATGNFTGTIENRQTGMKKAILTVIAKDKKIAYGESASNGGVDIRGFVNGETEDVLGGELTYKYMTQGDNPEEYIEGSPVGTYDIILDGFSADNYEFDYLKGTLTVEKSTPAAPEGLAGTAPSTCCGSDGKITGTTVEMEYSMDADFSLVKNCMADKTEGFAEGTYYVRFKATDNTNAGKYAKVVIPKSESHIFDRKVSDKMYLKSEATCIKSAVYYKSCVCGKASTMDTFTSGNPLGPDGHKNKTTVVPATTKANGTRTTVCEFCGSTETVTIPMIKVISISKSKYVYSGKAKAPVLTVKDKEGEALVKGTDYTVKYSGNKKVGKASAVVTFRGKYKGTITKTFKIVPKKAAVSKASTGKKKLTVKMKTKVASTGGKTYQIAYKQKGTSKWKYTTTTKKSKVIKKLKKGKRYYVKVRAYKTVSKVKYYGAWSKTKLSKKIK